MPHTYMCEMYVYKICVCVHFENLRRDEFSQGKNMRAGMVKEYVRQVGGTKICRGNCILVHQLYGNKNNNPFLFYCVCARGLSAWPLFETHCYYYFIPVLHCKNSNPV